jgi:hypothetical protein
VKLTKLCIPLEFCEAEFWEGAAKDEAKPVDLPFMWMFLLGFKSEMRLFSAVICPPKQVGFFIM